MVDGSEYGHRATLGTSVGRVYRTRQLNEALLATREAAEYLVALAVLKCAPHPTVELQVSYDG
jgi:hypothetical protein